MKGKDFETFIRDILKIPTLMIWGEENMALGKELTYGTG